MPIFGARFVMSKSPQEVEEFKKEINDREESLAQREDDLKKRREKLQVLQGQIELASRRNSTVSNVTVEDKNEDKSDKKSVHNPDAENPEPVLSENVEPDKKSVHSTDAVVTSAKNSSTCAQCVIQ